MTRVQELPEPRDATRAVALSPRPFQVGACSMQSGNAWPEEMQLEKTQIPRGSEERIRFERLISNVFHL